MVSVIKLLFCCAPHKNIAAQNICCGDGLHYNGSHKICILLQGKLLINTDQVNFTKAKLKVQTTNKFYNLLYNNINNAVWCSIRSLNTISVFPVGYFSMSLKNKIKWVQQNLEVHLVIIGHPNSRYLFYFSYN